MHELLQFFLIAGKLKRVKRAGWLRHKIRNPESVAEHSFRTAFMAAALAGSFRLNREKAITMALIHELAESETGDITPYDGISVRKKHHMEDRAMKRLCGTGHAHFYRLWKELEAGKTMEARFVKQLDRLELYLQAMEYERSDNKDLSEFFSFEKKKITDRKLKDLLRQIHAMRPRTSPPRR